MKPTAVIGGLGVMVLLGCWGCGPESTSVPPSAPVVTNTVASNALSSAPVRNAYEVLKGKWERPDGGYILEVRSADAAGQLEAGYFNPSPIKIALARAYREGESVKVFVELRDVNYPGCTYKLTYDTKADQLFGQYYQASMQQIFDVVFARVK